MHKSLVILPALVLSGGAALAQYDARLPLSGQLVLTPAYAFQTYNKFFLGNQKTDFFDTDQQNVYGTAEYALLDDVAFDLTLGYTRVISLRPGASVNDGLADTTMGVRYRLLDEYRSDSDFLPTVTARVGGIVDGTYDVGTPEAPGDGASGVEASLLLGKEFGESGFGLSALAGFRHRLNDVPDDFFCTAGLYKVFCDFFVTNVGYRHVQGLSGPDIGDPGLTFPEVKEIQNNIEGGFGFLDQARRYYGFYVAYTFDGRNTGERLVFGFSITLPFGGLGMPYFESGA